MMGGAPHVPQAAEGRPRHQPGAGARPQESVAAARRRPDDRSRQRQRRQAAHPWHGQGADSAHAFLASLAQSALAALCAFGALILAWHHPLAPALAFLGCTGLAMAACLAPTRWALLVLPALPLANLAPWTGAVAVEEFDLVLLAVAAGGLARLAWDRVQAPDEQAGAAVPPLAPSPSPGAVQKPLPSTAGASAAHRPAAAAPTPQAARRQASAILALPPAPATRWLLAVAAATSFALWRGLQAAGVDAQSAWQGLHDPTDSLRGAKGLFEALLLLPLLRAGWRSDPALATARLVQGLTWMLLAAGLSVLWERLAFGGLFDLSVTHAAGGLFWAVPAPAGPGPAPGALAAVLAVGMPFAAMAARTAFMAMAASARKAARAGRTAVPAGSTAAHRFDPGFGRAAPAPGALGAATATGAAVGAAVGAAAIAGSAAGPHGHGSAGWGTGWGPGPGQGIRMGWGSAGRDWRFGAVAGDAPDARAGAPAAASAAASGRWVRLAPLRAAGVPLLALALGAHACVVSFSPLAWLAVAVALLVFLALWPVEQQQRDPVTAPGRTSAGLADNGLFAGLAWLGGFAALVQWLFPASGWFCVMALGAGAALVLPLPAWRRRRPVAAWLVAATAIALALLAFLPADDGHLGGPQAVVAGEPSSEGAAEDSGKAPVESPKKRGSSDGSGQRSDSSAAAAAAGRVLPVLGVLLGVVALAMLRRRPAWPQRAGWQLGLLCALAVVGVMAALSARAPWPARVNALAQESQLRQTQWRQALAGLDGVSDWLLGRGLGGVLDGHGTGAFAPGNVEGAAAVASKPPEAAAASARASGSVRLVPQGDGWFVELAAGRTGPAGGPLLRLSQVVTAPADPRAQPQGATAADAASAAPVVAKLSLQVRPTREVLLMVELCARAAPQAGRCASHAMRLWPEANGEAKGELNGQARGQAKGAAIEAADGTWQTVVLPLPLPPGAGPFSGPWYAPQPVTLTIGVVGLDGGLGGGLDGGLDGSDDAGPQRPVVAVDPRVDIDKISLIDAGGRELLRNGSFDAGPANWVIAREPDASAAGAAGARPVTNAPLHLLVEQGLLGLAAWVLAAGCAFWRLSAGSARSRRLAVALLAAAAGMAVVGAVHSLFDTPRIVFLLSWLLVLGLALPGRRGRQRARR